MREVNQGIFNARPFADAIRHGIAESRTPAAEVKACDSDRIGTIIKHECFEK
jgi:hypothetical protein